MSVKDFQSRLLSIQTNLLNFAFTLTSDRDDAYDLLQDTTLKALDNKEKFIDNTNFKGWVFTIMRNIFINHYRRKARVAMIVDQSEDAYMLNVGQESESVTPEDSYAVHEILDTLDSFGEEYRVPFSMYLKGYKYAEIAEHMGLPVGTVKSRIFFARRRLRSCLEAYRP